MKKANIKPKLRKAYYGFGSLLLKVAIINYYYTKYQINKRKRRLNLLRVEAHLFSQKYNGKRVIVVADPYFPNIQYDDGNILFRKMDKNYSILNREGFKQLVVRHRFSKTLEWNILCQSAVYDTDRKTFNTED